MGGLPFGIDWFCAFIFNAFWIQGRAEFSSAITLLLCKIILNSQRDKSHKLSYYLIIVILVVATILSALTFTI